MLGISGRLLSLFLSNEISNKLYHIIDDTFKLPEPQVDEDKYRQYLEEYEELKWRLLRETLLFGAAGTLATTVTQGREDGAVFAIGVLVGAGYLLLLEQQADKLGRSRG